MKKILSFALIFVLSLTVYSTYEIKAEATEDVTITFHIHQFDGDYTNTGLGIWDGVDWNNWDDVQTSTDDFGAVITKTWTVDKINNANFLDSIQVKPSRDANVDDAANYLAPASVSGEVYLDVTSLKDGSKTTMDVYYVEGAKGFYVNTTGNALFMNIYFNGAIAADATAYDGWGMHTWNVGPGGTSVEWATPLPFEIDVEIQAGDYLVPMKLGVIEVGSGATAQSGFIVHKGDEKSWGSDMFFDGASLLDDVNGNKAQVVFYEHGKGEFTDGYSTFLDNVQVSWQDNLKNKFLGGTVLTPESIQMTMLSQKSIFDLTMDRFSITDQDGNPVAFSAIDYHLETPFAPVATDVEIEFQTYVRVYVKSDFANVGMVGAFQGWDISAPLAPVAEYNGYDVFELSTTTLDFQYVLVGHDRTDDVATTEVDESAFSWDDKFSGNDNLGQMLQAGDVYMASYVYENNTLYTGDGFVVGDPTALVNTETYTYASTATCADGENLLTLFIDSPYATEYLGVVGSIQTPDEWTPGAAIESTLVTEGGISIFEICTDKETSAFKVLFNDTADDPLTTDVDESAFAWGNTEVIKSDKAIAWGEDQTSMVLYFDYAVAEAVIADNLGDYVPQIEVSNTYRYTIYLNPGDLDITDFNVVGAFEENSWDPSFLRTFTMQDAEGNYYMDFAIHTKDFEYKILYKGDAETFDWPQAIFGNDNVVSNLGELAYKADYVSYEMVEEAMVWSIDSLMDVTTNMVTFEFADDTLVYGDTYTVSYIEMYDETEDTVITYDVTEFNVSNMFVPGDEVLATGSYALENNKLQVVFANPVDTTLDMGVTLVDKDGNTVTISSISSMYEMGTYSATTTCDAGFEKLTVYLQTDEDYELSQVALVGTPQQSGYDATLNEGEGGWTNGGWSPENGINPVGKDSNGNLVFEICVELVGMDGVLGTEDDILTHEFKVLFAGDDNAFAWGDTELTPQIVFDFDGPVTMFLEEGNALGETDSFIYDLGANLDPTNTYNLVYVDDNGFVIELPVILDTEAPVIDFARNTSVELELNNDATAFNLMDYFTVLRFVDNRDGVVSYTVTTTVDPSVVGEQVVTLTAVDSWGNTATETFTFTVNDVIAPTITLQTDVTFEAGTTAPNWEDYATVEGGTLTINASQVDMANAGTFYVTYTATDEAGNTTSETLEVTITAPAVDPEDVIEDTGCFGSVGVGSAFAIVLAIVGGSAFVLIRKQH